MDPAVFLTNPESGAVKAFMKVARPSIRRWVENHYEYFRRQFTPSRPRLYGSFRIEGGHMLRHHLLGEHSTEQDGRQILFSLPYDNKTSLMEDYPRMNLDFDSWLYGAHAFLQQGHIGFKRIHQQQHCNRMFAKADKEPSHSRLLRK